VACTDRSDGTDELAGELAEALGTILQHPVTPVDLHPRRDGAMAPVLGLIALAGPQHRRTAAQLVVEWGAAGSAEPERATELVAPVTLDIPSLHRDGALLLGGLRLVAPARDAPAIAVLTGLAATAATLAGGLPEAVLVDPGKGYERLPGWIARLRLLAGAAEAGSVDDAADVGGWICTVQANASSVYVPNAPEGSLWRGLLAAIRDCALAALAELGQALPKGSDFQRRADPSFFDLIDRDASVTLNDHPVASGYVLQNIRVPRMHEGRIVRGVALLAPNP
jgi:hypothetical protein